MEYSLLGSTGIEVSQICFGSLVMGPLQRNMDIQEGARVIAHAFAKGINFIDTAQLYGTYEYIRQAIRISGSRPVIATKSYAYNREKAEESLEEALVSLDTDHIDIFLLHEQESSETLRGHKEALDFYIKKKKEGYIRAVGISSHSIAAVRAAALMEEIDIIHPLLNHTGLGITDGGREQMEEAVELAFSRGKGIYTMKALGGGSHIPDYEKAMGYIRDFKFKHSVAIGMQYKEEVNFNVSFFETGKMPAGIIRKERRLHIDSWCTGCGICVEHCGQRALEMIGASIYIHQERCVLCGYCSSYCTEFAIKIH
jgi:uncharacterized protein